MKGKPSQKSHNPRRQAQENASGPRAGAKAAPEPVQAVFTEFCEEGDTVADAYARVTAEATLLIETRLRELGSVLCEEEREGLAFHIGIWMDGRQKRDRG